MYALECLTLHEKRELHELKLREENSRTTDKCRWGLEWMKEHSSHACPLQAHWDHWHNMETKAEISLTPGENKWEPINKDFQVHLSTEGYNGVGRRDAVKSGLAADVIHNRKVFKRWINNIKTSEEKPLKCRLKLIIYKGQRKIRSKRMKRFWEEKKYTEQKAMLEEKKP